MLPDQLEQILRDLPRVGTLVKHRKYRQVWRFEVADTAYYLKFYPRGKAVASRDWWRRAFRGSPALNEFTRLQWLQKAKVPAPRAVAMLSGFVLQDVTGDAVILQAIEPSVPLDKLLNEQALLGRSDLAQHRRLVDEVIDLVRRLADAGYGHGDLHLGNFLLRDHRLFLIDAYAVRPDGLSDADLQRLGASVGRFATTADLVRGWRAIRGERPMPAANTLADEIWADQIDRIFGGNRYFGRLKILGWHAVFFRKTNYPRRWSSVSRLDISAEDWRAALPPLIEQIEAGSLSAMKESRSGDVRQASMALGGETVAVVVKRPYRRYWHRYLSEIGRGARGRRGWLKAWHLVVRDLPTAWPLALLERRRLGYVTDTFVIFEKVPGPTLWKVDLDALTTGSRDQLFRRVGRLLRLVERHGFSHFDAKASNWIVRPDEARGPSPVLIDVDGIRRRRWPGLGLQRLLRSLFERRQYSPADSYALCRGYAPYARLQETPADAGDTGK